MKNAELKTIILDPKQPNCKVYRIWNDDDKKWMNKPLIHRPITFFNELVRRYPAVRLRIIELICYENE